MSDDPTPQTAYLAGAYEMCALLLTSPRFNRPQREVIEQQAHIVKDRMVALGMTFEGGAS